MLFLATITAATFTTLNPLPLRLSRLIRFCDLEELESNRMSWHCLRPTVLLSTSNFVQLRNLKEERSGCTHCIVHCMVHCLPTERVQPLRDLLEIRKCIQRIGTALFAGIQFYLPNSAESCRMLFIECCSLTGIHWLMFTDYSLPTDVHRMLSTDCFLLTTIECCSLPSTGWYSTVPTVNFTQANPPSGVLQISLIWRAFSYSPERETWKSDFNVPSKLPV